MRFVIKCNICIKKVDYYLYMLDFDLSFTDCKTYAKIKKKGYKYESVKLYIKY